MSYLLDTDTCIYAMKDLHRVRERLSTQRRSELWVSAVTRAELVAGATASGSPSKNLHLVSHFLQPFTLIEFSVADADGYGAMHAQLGRKGQLFGPMDMLIAAQALSRGLTLVTNNQREFRRVTGLHLVNWAA